MLSYQLPTIEYLRLRFHLLAQRDYTLPAWKGSLIRGAFGHALRRTVCTMNSGQHCRDCLLKSQCAYTRLFETFVTEPRPPMLKGLLDSPRPFIFEPSDENKNYQPGNVLWFDMILIGNIIQYLPYIVFAIYQMGKTGMGRNRYPFDLMQAFCWQFTLDKKKQKALNNNQSLSWKLIYDGETQRILFQPETLSLRPSIEEGENFSSGKIKFLTQTRLRVNNRLIAAFNFRELVFKMLRRILELAHFYMPGKEINWEFHDLLAAARAIKIVNKNLSWSDLGRYSNRQQTKMKMGGFIGDITVQGNLNPFYDVFRFAEVLHVGKGATFGLGKCLIERG